MAQRVVEVIGERAKLGGPVADERRAVHQNEALGCEISEATEHRPERRRVCVAVHFAIVGDRRLPFVRRYTPDSRRKAGMNCRIHRSVPDLGTRRILARKLSPFQFFDGLTGLGTNPPPQFGQTFSRILSTQAAQNVHS